MDAVLAVLSIVAFVLAVLSLVFSWYAWNNPKSDDFVNVRHYVDESGEKNIVYEIRKNKKNYQTIRIDLNKSEVGEPHKHIADKSNNKGIDFAKLDSLEKVTSLNYRDV